jgi:hypothetical protein
MEIMKMDVREFAGKYKMRIISGKGNIGNKVSGVYICDLLSWVMSHAQKDNIWITVHTNLNIVAVALLTEVACIIIPENIEVEQATLDKADQEGVVIVSTELSAYEVCCKARECGI